MTVPNGVSDQLLIRAPVASDVAFIKATMLNGIEQNCFDMKPVKRSIYFPAQEKVLRAMFARDHCRVMIAALKDDPDIIISYLVYEPLKEPTVHYMYTKQKFRRLGVMSLLHDEAGISFAEGFQFTYMSKAMQFFCSRYPDLIYNPFLR